MLVEYVWLDANGSPRSKTKVIYEKAPKNKEDLNLPLWNYDGSSTGQADGNNSEVILKPQSVFSRPISWVATVSLPYVTLTTQI